MKKTFCIEELECAHCAAKMENEISKLEGVKSVTVAFLTQKLTIEADDELFDSIAVKAAAICKKIEPDCEVIIK
jgi:copper chaperone CopZ